MRIVLFIVLSLSIAHSFDLKEFCSGLQQCTGERPSFCTDSLSKKNKDTEYTQKYCRLYSEVYKRGIGYETAIGRELYSNLGIENRVEYLIKGTLPISKKLMDFLMTDIPHTAQLINAYQETEYFAEYTSKDKKSFKGHNGGSLRGNLTLVAEDSINRELTWFGDGAAEVLWWSLKGTVLLFMEYRAINDRELSYHLRVVVFNRSSLINGIMDMGVFRSVVSSKINKIITHIQESAKLYAQGQRRQIETYRALKTPEGEAFLKRVHELGTKK